MAEKRINPYDSDEYLYDYSDAPVANLAGQQLRDFIDESQQWAANAEAVGGYVPPYAYDLGGPEGYFNAPQKTSVDYSDPAQVAALDTQRANHQARTNYVLGMTQSAVADAQARDYINSLLETDTSLESPTEYLAAEIAAADAEERRVTGMLNEFGETYAEEQARLAFER